MYKYKYEDPHYILYDSPAFLIPGRPMETGEEIELFRSEIVAIAFTTAPNGMMWTMHKHGSPELVNRWARIARSKYTKHGLSDMAKEIVVIEGKFPVEEINKVIEITGYIKKFYEKFSCGLENIGGKNGRRL